MLDPTEPQPNPIAAALAPYADRLRPEAVGQLARIWADDFTGLSPAAIQDFVNVRMASGNYNHFMALGHPGPPTLEDQIRGTIARQGYGNGLAGRRGR